MKISPEPDDAMFVRRLLAQEPIEDSPELLEGLRRLRSFRAVPAPEPTGDLAVLLRGTVPPLPKRSGRRGMVLSFALAGAMAVGTTGVAASNDERITCESVVDAVPLQQGAPAAQRTGQPGAAPAQEPAEQPGQDTGTETGEQQAAPHADTAASTGAPTSAGMPEVPEPDSGVAGPATAVPLSPDAASAPAATAGAGAAPTDPAGPGPVPGKPEETGVPAPAPAPGPAAVPGPAPEPDAGFLNGGGGAGLPAEWQPSGPEPTLPPGVRRADERRGGPGSVERGAGDAAAGRGYGGAGTAGPAALTAP